MLGILRKRLRSNIGWPGILRREALWRPAVKLRARGGRLSRVERALTWGRHWKGGGRGSHARRRDSGGRECKLHLCLVVARLDGGPRNPRNGLPTDIVSNRQIGRRGGRLNGLHVSYSWFIIRRALVSSWREVQIGAQTLPAAHPTAATASARGRRQIVLHQVDPGSLAVATVNWAPDRCRRRSQRWLIMLCVVSASSGVRHGRRENSSRNRGSWSGLHLRGPRQQRRPLRRSDVAAANVHKRGVGAEAREKGRVLRESRALRAFRHLVDLHHFGMERPRVNVLLRRVGTRCQRSRSGHFHSDGRRGVLQWCIRERYVERLLILLLMLHAAAHYDRVDIRALRL